MKKLADFINKHFDSVQTLAAAFATFATVFAFANSADLSEFFTAYFAGGASAVAMLIFFDEEDD